MFELNQLLKLDFHYHLNINKTIMAKWNGFHLLGLFSNLPFANMFGNICILLVGWRRWKR